ncbi:hypothetical protein F4678DRAFT_282773 [Xylaria arbuscula]|nr:hypothetical protein F4678DRAFT_282773 [Xylaria arbuscula]
MRRTQSTSIAMLFSILILSLVQAAELQPSDLDLPWPISTNGVYLNCTKSVASRYSVARRGRDSPSAFSTGGVDHWELPMIEPMNATGGEQWEFDGVANDGRDAFIFGFYRDPNYGFMGAGNLRSYAEFVFANGSHYAVVDYAEQATVEACSGPGGATRGVWQGKGFRYEFIVSEDMRHVSIAMDTADVQVRVDMNSVAPPRYADNAIWPSQTGSALTVTHFYWVEPVPAANLTFHAVVNQRSVSWTGMGGHERLWGAFNWYTCLASLVAVKFRAGPYALSFLELGSGLEEGLRVPSVLLARDGIKIAATRRTQPSDVEDYMEIRKLYGGVGATTEHLEDKVTGMEVRVFSPSQKKEWRFTVEHVKMLFEYILGEGVGGTAYSGLARGGEIGSRHEWDGPAFTEIMRMPKKSWLLHKNYRE